MPGDALSGHGDKNNTMGGYGERCNHLGYTDNYLKPVKTGDLE